MLTPAAKWRSLFIPAVGADNDDAVCGHDGESRASGSISRPRNYSGSQLIRRVFDIDVTECPQCGGRPRILTAIQSPDPVRKILKCLGLPSRAPPIAPARTGDPDDLQLEWA